MLTRWFSILLLWATSTPISAPVQAAGISRACPPAPGSPPILVLDVAEAAALPSFGTATERDAARGPGCAALRVAWPQRVAAAQRALQAPDKRDLVAQASVLEAQLARDALACPAWAGPATVQRMLLREHHGLFSPTHGAEEAT